MNSVIFIRMSNLLEGYFGKRDLVVVFTKPNCSKCLSLIPYLYKIDKQITVAVVDVEKAADDVRHIPNSINTKYPLILYFRFGKFVRELTIDDIKKIELYV